MSIRVRHWNCSFNGGGWNIAGNPFVIQAVPGYLSSLVAIIVVSLLTSHAADEQVEALYQFGR